MSTETINKRSSNSPDQIAATEAQALSYLKRTLAELMKVKSEIDALKRQATEPIAIVGAACRLPGSVISPESLWSLVNEARTGTSPLPTDRSWNADQIHASCVSAGGDGSYGGGFVYDVADFDAGFFGISPREALAMDPQQRLLLECAWEALERAGIGPSALKNTNAGAFIGGMVQDYAFNFTLEGSASSAELGPYLSSGNAGGLMSGRIAHYLGLEGPAVTVDTACSSSLVALHLAAQSLRRTECDLILCGGAAIFSSPKLFPVVSAVGGISRSNICRSFAAGADGPVWAEGVGVLVLERLSDAVRNGHQVWAVVRGTAVNQDGASNGLSAPNGPSQQRVIRQALANAGLSAAEVDVVEAHGTGTVLGDPIEAQALLATYGQNREHGRPVLLGSLKSNIGHAQAAAGVAGVIKMVMALRHGLVPPTLHVDAPSPHVDWASGAVELVTEPRDWPATGAPRRAAVSSFGASGTNAHVILEQAPVELAAVHDVPGLDGDLPCYGAGAGSSADPAAATDGTGISAAGLVPWVVSARTAEGLSAQAARLMEFLGASPEVSLCDVGWSLATGRERFEHRAVVLAGDREAYLTGLSALAGGRSAPGVLTGVAGPGRVGFVFGGQGSQWIGMGRQLWESSPVFRAQLQECAQALSPFVDWSLVDVIQGLEGAPGLDRVDVVQPVLWAVMVSLAGLWRSSGVVPDGVVGHSQGEIAAACVAGVLSLQDGARVIALRSKALAAIAGSGGMVSVAAPLTQVEQLLAGRAGVGVAAVNGPGSVVVSGSTAELERFVEELTTAEIRNRRIEVDYASHSEAVDICREQMQTDLAAVSTQNSQVTFFSSVTGGGLEGAALNADYWYRNLRERVCFDQAVQAMLEQGYRFLIEVSPHPVQTVGIQECIDQHDTDAVVVGTLRREGNSLEQFTTAAAALHVAGAEVDWQSILGPGHWIDTLPTYAFQRERYWFDPPTTATNDVTGAGDSQPLTAGLR